MTLPHLIYISNSQSFYIRPMFDTSNTCSVQSFLLRVLLWSIWWPTPTYMNERRVERNFRAIRQVFMKDWGKRGLCYGSTLKTFQDLNSSLSILKNYLRFEYLITSSQMRSKELHCITQYYTHQGIFRKPGKTSKFWPIHSTI